MSNIRTLKSWPTIATDEAAVKFVDQADLSESDWSKAVPVTLKLNKKNAQLNVRMSGCDSDQQPVLQPLYNGQNHRHQETAE